MMEIMMMEIMVSCRWRWRSCLCFGDGDQKHKFMAISCHLWFACDVNPFMHLILLGATVALLGDPSLKFQDKIVFSPSVHRCESSSFRDTKWWSGVIDSTFAYNGCKPVLHMQNTRVKLDEPSMYRYGLGTQETERSNMSHIVDVINMEMFTIEATPSHVMIGHGLVDLDHVTLRQPKRCWFEWEFFSNMINWTHYHEHSVNCLCKIML